MKLPDVPMIVRGAPNLIHDLEICGRQQLEMCVPQILVRHQEMVEVRIFDVLEGIRGNYRGAWDFLMKESCHCADPIKFGETFLWARSTAPRIANLGSQQNAGLLESTHLRVRGHADIQRLSDLSAFLQFLYQQLPVLIC